MIIPAADAARLLPGAGPAAIPGLAVPATLEAALGELEALQLTLARLGGAGDGDLAGDGPAPGAAGPGVTLIAAPEPGSARRLAAILDAGRRTGTGAVLLGAWPAGTTCQVAADGTVTAVTPPARTWTEPACSPWPPPRRRPSPASCRRPAAARRPQPRPARPRPRRRAAPPGTQTAPGASATSAPPRPRRSPPACPARCRPRPPAPRSRRAATRDAAGAAG